MSTLNVDNISEYTSGNGVEIPGHILQVVSATDTTATSYTIANTNQKFEMAQKNISKDTEAIVSKIMSQLKVNSIVPVAGLPSGAKGGIIQVKQNLCPQGVIQ